MSTRTYSGTLVLEGIFDAIPVSNTNLISIANRVFSPQVPIVEINCGTLLGESILLTSESQGFVALSTGLPIDRIFIQNNLSVGVYQVNVRSLATCISVGGVCQTCYFASRPMAILPAVNTTVKIQPEFHLQTESVLIHNGGVDGYLSYDVSTYDVIYIYNNGVLLTPSSYTITGSHLVLNVAVIGDTTLIVKYSVFTRVPFFYWLAGTFGGSLLGIQPLPIDFLSLKPSLLTSLLPQNDINSLISKIQASNIVPSEIKEYLPHISSSLEKALLAIAVDSVFSNVTS